MFSTKYCFTINNYFQAVEIIKISKINKIIPTLFINYYLADRLGVDWIHALCNMLQADFQSKDFKIYVDAKKNYGLCINLIEKKINYIRIQADKKTNIRLNQIAKLNKVLINPSFSIINLSNYKDRSTKLKKLYNKV